MVFSSIPFILFFLPAVLLVYYLSPARGRNSILLVFSILFYAWGSPGFLPYLLGSCLVNFWLVGLIYRSEQRNPRRWLLTLSIMINLGLLIYFKYSNFFLENLSVIRQWAGSPPLTWERVLLPIGISFYTFQSITYTLDVYRRQQTPQSNPLNYLLFILMFPQLLAGPIIRYREIADQILARKETWEDLLYGFYRFTLGLAKKVLIANVLALQVNHLLSFPTADLGTAASWLAMIAYTFQLYFDFAGYSDMAIGLGRMFGFRFPENFNNPYISGSVTEFWRRWHMTFSVFMKNYLYYPLGGSRVATRRRLWFNLWLVFLVSGFWHGASWNFVLYGAFHGLFIFLEKLFLLKWYKGAGRFIPILLTFFVIVLTRVFFRITELPDAAHLLHSMFTWKPDDNLLPASPHFYFILVLAIFFSFITLSKKGLKVQTLFYETSYSIRQHGLMTLLFVILLILSIASLSGQEFNPFIYFRF